jgi:hypothetical protein
MNNLFIIAIAGTVGLALFSNSQRNIAETEAALAQLRLKQETASANADCSRAEMRRLEKVFVSQKESVQKLRSEIDASAGTESAEIDLSQLTPQKEGFWPADKPYFYIAKTRLNGVLYWPFTSDDRLSDSAMKLFEMTLEEQRAANAAYRNFRDQLREVEAAHSSSTNPPTWIASWPGVKKSVYVEPIPREEIAAVDQQFHADLSGAIGDERASLLFRRIIEETEGAEYGLARGRIFTLIREGDHYRIAQSYGEGNTMTTSSTRDDILREVRHLFPEGID